MKNKGIINLSNHNQIELFEDNSSTKKFVYKPIKALAHTPPYKIHKYFARRPWNVFSELIKTFSNTNDIILDPFSGGGVTIYEGIKLKRKVIGYDLNPLSIFIIENMVKKKKDLHSFNFLIDKLVKRLEELYSDYVFLSDGIEIKIDWIEATFRVKCPECNELTILSNDLKHKAGFYFCINEKCTCSKTINRNSFAQRKAERLGIEYLYLVGNSGGERIVHKINNDDLNRLNIHLENLKRIIKEENIIIPKDLIPENWDRQKEDTLKDKGILFFQDFFTERNLLINTILLNEINKLKPTLSDEDYGLLRIVFSNTLKETNIMSFTNDTWQGGKPTTWSKHAFWIPSQFCEVSIIKSFKNSIKRILDSLAFNNNFDYEVIHSNSFTDIKNISNIYLNNISVEYTDIPNNSIDAIITDPPYGSNVQYLELSHFWYHWNKDMYRNTPDFSLEAISNRKKGFEGAKDMYKYEENLYKVFKKSHDILKEDGYMVLTFNNKDIGAWLALLFSIFRSGFTLDENGIYFQDGVENYKQTAHTRFDGAPYGDFIYVFKKRINHPIKIYENEEDFFYDLDKILNEISKYEDISKYDLLILYFDKTLPIIESFSKSFLVNNSHNLFEKLNKTYLNKIY